MIAAIVPCHREPPAPDLIDAIREHVDVVLIVDDGSPVGSTGELERLRSEHRCELLRLGSNEGKGHALVAGLHRLRESSDPLEAVIVLDGDGQHPPARIPAFLSAAGGAELVVGDRFDNAGSMSLRRRIANRLASRALALMTRRSVRDSQCGMRLLRGRALAIPFPGGRYESETLHLKRCLRAGVPVAWVPIPCVSAGNGSSFREIRDTARVAAALLR